MPQLKRFALGALRALFTMLLIDSLVLTLLNAKNSDWQYISSEVLTGIVAGALSLIAVVYLFKNAALKPFSYMYLLKGVVVLLLSASLLIIYAVMMSSHNITRNNNLFLGACFILLFGVASLALMPAGKAKL